MEAERVIYVVFTGEYSDRREICAFANKAVAEAWIASEVEKGQLDDAWSYTDMRNADVSAVPLVTEPPGRVLYVTRYVRVDDQGEVKRDDRHERTVWDLPDQTRYSSIVDPHGPSPQLIVEGTDAKRVDKAAQEYIARCKAEKAGIA